MTKRELEELDRTYLARAMKSGAGRSPFGRGSPSLGVQTTFGGLGGAGA